MWSEIYWNYGHHFLFFFWPLLSRITLLLIAGHISHTIGVNEGTRFVNSLNGLLGGKLKTTPPKKNINHNKTSRQ